jgi:iron complex transport system substrate-binding protein
MPGFASLLAASVALRVASLNMCADEYLLLLAKPAEIASVSRLSRDPADSSLWRLGQRYPGNRGDLESAMKTRPTLLLTMGGGGRSTTVIARRMGLKTVDLPFPLSIDDVARNLSTVATALGEPRRADAWRLRLSGLRTANPVSRDAIFLGAGGNSVGAQSVEAEWMRMAGLRQRTLPGGRASLELLATRPPAVLLRSTYRRSERSIGQTWLEHPLARPKTSRILEVDGRPWTCAGPLMLGEVERLRKLL